MRSADKPLKVSFFGHFGSLNSGNESTLLAIVSRLRAVAPDCELRCICTNPNVVKTRDRIDAVPITTRSGAIWDRTLPLQRRIGGVWLELWQYARAFRKLKGTDMLIIPGTGLLTDAYGIYDWGPYNLFKWVLMARLRGSKVLFVSIGAGPIHRTTGRLLIRSALFLADYRSYRDNASRSYLEGIGLRVDHDPVYPDLVFGLPATAFPSRDPISAGSRRVVGLGLMESAGKYSSADAGRDTYATYLDSLAAFASWLLEHDYDIRLLLGDGDTNSVAEFRSALRARIGDYDDARIVGRPMATVEDVLSELAAADVVVATRFHNVLLAFLLNKPAIAISFHHKCSSLMEQMELSDYCHEIGRIDCDRMIEQFRELERNREVVKRTIERGVRHARAALDEQYELLFASA